MTASPTRESRAIPADRAKKWHWLQLAVHIGALLPLIVLIAQYFTVGLTRNPIQFVTQSTGKTGLILLVLSLVSTPLGWLLKWNPALKVRRALGLYGFLYIALHLATFAVWDYRLDLGLIWEDVGTKRYVIVGFSAFLLLLPLAITSTKGWQRRLGKRWRPLHRLAYVAIPLGVLHFAWVVKSLIGRPEPIFWGVGVAVLLALRIPAVKARIGALRK